MQNIVSSITKIKNGIAITEITISSAVYDVPPDVRNMINPSKNRAARKHRDTINSTK